MINLMAREAHKAIGTYFYFFPTFAQARKVLWDGMDKTGFKFIDHFPKELVKNKNESEMRIELKFGSAIQFVGTDNFDAIRGTNPIGTVWSEFAFQNPAAWDVVRPILKENGGWALFNTTPNGKNHAKRLWDMATANPSWFTQKLTIADTGVLTAADIDEERRSGMTEEMIQQEYYCSFDVGMLGSYYGAEMEQARMEGRITPLPFRMDVGVDVYFDLGISDETAMWFGQTDAEFYNMVNYYENNNKTFNHYAQVIDDYVTYKKGKLGHIYVPHDANKRDWVTGKTALHAFEEKFGKERVTRVEIGGLETGIQATRAVIPSVRFDSDTCAQGVNCLENYSREFNQITKSFNPKPKHDWASHGADSFRTFGVTYKSYQHKTIIGSSSRKDDDDYEKEYRAIIKEDYGDDL